MQLCILGYNPSLAIFGEPTHERTDLDDTQRKLPDVSNIKAFIIPAGFGIIMYKGTWHDFPISCGPPTTVFLINTKEVIEALSSLESPGPMDCGDVYKVQLSDHFDFQLKHPDPRPMVRKLGLVSNCDIKYDAGV